MRVEWRHHPNFAGLLEILNENDEWMLPEICDNYADTSTALWRDRHTPCYLTILGQAAKWGWVRKDG